MASYMEKHNFQQQKPQTISMINMHKYVCFYLSLLNGSYVFILSVDRVLDE